MHQLPFKMWCGAWREDILLQTYTRCPKYVLMKTWPGELTVCCKCVELEEFIKNKTKKNCLQNYWNLVMCLVRYEWFYYRIKPLMLSLCRGVLKHCTKCTQSESHASFQHNLWPGMHLFLSPCVNYLSSPVIAEDFLNKLISGTIIVFVLIFLTSS